MMSSLVSDNNPDDVIISLRLSVKENEQKPWVWKKWVLMKHDIACIVGDVGSNFNFFLFIFFSLTITIDWYQPLDGSNDPFYVAGVRWKKESAVLKAAPGFLSLSVQLGPETSIETRINQSDKHLEQGNQIH